MPSDPALVVGALVPHFRGKHAPTVLCFKRSHRRGVAFPGQWCFPGGKPHPGETLRQAAERELYEETSVYATSWDEECRILLAPPLVPRPLTLVYFLVSSWMGEAKAREEGTQVAWFPWNELISPPAGRIYTPGTTVLVERIEADGGL